MKRPAANIGFLILIFLISLKIHGQDSTLRKPLPFRWKTYQKTEILAGFSWQGNVRDKVETMRYVEIGVGKSVHRGSMHGPASVGVFIAEEMYFGSATTVFGTKIGAYTHWLADLGFSVIYYTDLKKGNLKLRPEAGVGMGGLRIVVGYNIPTINNRAYELLQQNNMQLSIQFLVPVKKKEIKQEGLSIFRQLLKKQ